MAKLRVGQPAQVLFRSEPERPLRGSVARLGRQADRETREFIVDVLVLELPENWSIGQRADVFIETARSLDALKVPTAFVVREGEQEGVHVAVNGVAAWRPIQPGLRGRDLIEVTAGLDPGSTLIRPLDAKNKLTVGRRIALP
jgi:HlyD family secretion protein